MNLPIPTERKTQPKGEPSPKSFLEREFPESQIRAELENFLNFLAKLNDMSSRGVSSDMPPDVYDMLMEERVQIIALTTALTHHLGKARNRVKKDIALDLMALLESKKIKFISSLEAYRSSLVVWIDVSRLLSPRQKKMERNDIAAELREMFKKIVFPFAEKHLMNVTFSFEWESDLDLKRTKVVIGIYHSHQANRISGTSGEILS